MWSGRAHNGVALRDDERKGTPGILLDPWAFGYCDIHHDQG